MPIIIIAGILLTFLTFHVTKIMTCALEFCKYQDYFLRIISSEISILILVQHFYFEFQLLFFYVTLYIHWIILTSLLKKKMQKIQAFLLLTPKKT